MRILSAITEDQRSALRNCRTYLRLSLAFISTIIDCLSKHFAPSLRYAPARDRRRETLRSTNSRARSILGLVARVLKGEGNILCSNVISASASSSAELRSISATRAATTRAAMIRATGSAAVSPVSARTMAAAAFTAAISAGGRAGRAIARTGPHRARGRVTGSSRRPPWRCAPVSRSPCEAIRSRPLGCP